jgi:hypothetical protein
MRSVQPSSSASVAAFTRCTIVLRNRAEASRQQAQQGFGALLVATAAASRPRASPSASPSLRNFSAVLMTSSPVPIAR